jgi:hypothetical protein
LSPHGAAQQKLIDNNRALGHVTLDLHEVLVRHRAGIIVGKDGLVYGTTDRVHDELVRMLDEIETLGAAIVQEQEDGMSQMRLATQDLERTFR